MLVMVLPALLLFWAVGYQGWQGWSQRASIGADQGRYLYFGLPGLLVACGLGLARLPRALRRWAPLAVFAVAAAYQAYAALDVLDFFWGPPGTDLSYQVHNAVAWSVWTGAQLAVLGGWAAVVVVITALALTAKVDGGGPATFEPRGSDPDQGRGRTPAPTAAAPGRHRAT